MTRRLQRVFLPVQDITLTVEISAVSSPFRYFLSLKTEMLSTLCDRA
ncbi:hypothetical protein ACSYAD_01290 [Acaryochloris marina NIES-2412]